MRSSWLMGSILKFLSSFINWQPVYYLYHHQFRDPNLRFIIMSLSVSSLVFCWLQSLHKLYWWYHIIWTIFTLIISDWYREVRSVRWSLFQSTHFYMPSMVSDLGNGIKIFIFVNQDLSDSRKTVLWLWIIKEFYKITNHNIQKSVLTEI